jgi:hypothetical protein
MKRLYPFIFLLLFSSYGCGADSFSDQAPSPPTREAMIQVVDPEGNPLPRVGYDDDIIGYNPGGAKTMIGKLSNEEGIISANVMKGKKTLVKIYSTGSTREVILTWSDAGKIKKIQLPAPKHYDQFSDSIPKNEQVLIQVVDENKKPIPHVAYQIGIGSVVSTGEPNIPLQKKIYHTDEQGKVIQRVKKGKVVRLVFFREGYEKRKEDIREIDGGTLRIITL